jgi:hypothetical protein
MSALPTVFPLNGISGTLAVGRNVPQARIACFGIAVSHRLAKWDASVAFWRFFRKSTDFSD